MKGQGKLRFFWGTPRAEFSCGRIIENGGLEIKEPDIKTINELKIFVSGKFEHLDKHIGSELKQINEKLKELKIVLMAMEKTALRLVGFVAHYFGLLKNQQRLSVNLDFVYGGEWSQMETLALSLWQGEHPSHAHEPQGKKRHPRPSV